MDENTIHIAVQPFQTDQPRKGAGILLIRVSRVRPSFKDLLGLWADAHHRLDGSHLRDPSLYLNGKVAVDKTVTRAEYQISASSTASGEDPRYRLFYRAVMRNGSGCLMVSLERGSCPACPRSLMALSDVRDMPALDFTGYQTNPGDKVEIPAAVVHLGLEVARTLFYLLK